MFCADQIICIDSPTNADTDRSNLLLLAEVIQIIPERDRCWARPLALAQWVDYQLQLLHDLREAAQLILPTHLFREALDTEALPVMTALLQWDKPAGTPEHTENAETLSRHALHRFIRTLPL